MKDEKTGQVSASRFPKSSLEQFNKSCTALAMPGHTIRRLCGLYGLPGGSSEIATVPCMPYFPG